jgi:hypothetical protein
MDDFLRATALEDLMVKSDDVEEVVSAPEGVNAIRTDSESADNDPVWFVVGVGRAVPGESDAVTGMRLRFAVDRFGFLTAILLCVSWFLLLSVGYSCPRRVRVRW